MAFEKDQCVLVPSDSTYEGKQGHTFQAGISRETVGAQKLGFHTLEIPPGGRSRAHFHAEHESAIYVVTGEADVWHGAGLKEYMTVKAGDFVYVPPGVPHLPANRSSTDILVAVVARTDPNEQESVVLLPELDDVGLAAEAHG